MAKVRFETGQVVNFEGKPSPQDIEEVSRQLNIAPKEEKGFKSVSDKLLPTFFTGATPERGERTLLGNVFERPGAAVRSGIRALPQGFSAAKQAYTKGANVPEEVPTFLQQSQEAPVKTTIPTTGNKFIDALSNTERFSRGLGRDILATGADVATNPADLLGFFGGKTPTGGGGNLADMAAKTQTAQKLGKFLNQERQVPQLIKTTEQRANQLIDKSIEKAIRPSVSGKSTFAQTQKYKSNAREAVRAIIENKNNIQFIDESGQSVSKLPESLNEFSQAISQTKTKVFNAYDDLLKQSGREGAKIDLNPIANELDQVINNKTLKIKDPSIIKYAEDLKGRLLSQGELTPGEADDLVKTFNEGLQAFYKNPSFESSSKATVEAGVTNNLRRALDKVVNEATDKQFQPLKNRYGSLRAVEKDVNRRAIVDARKNIKGLIDYTDIFSGGDIVRGLLTSNPAAIAQGTFQIGFKNIYKFMNDPNRIVKGMFRDVEKIERTRGIIKSFTGK